MGGAKVHKTKEKGWVIAGHEERVCLPTHAWPLTTSEVTPRSQYRASSTGFLLPSVLSFGAQTTGGPRFQWRDQSACDIIFGLTTVCVSFRAYGLGWSIMVYDVRLSTETRDSAEIWFCPDNGISSCGNGQDWGYGEKTDRTPDDRCTRPAEEQGVVNQAAGEFCSASLSLCFSAVSTGRHPKPHSQPFHMTHSHCSLPKHPQVPPAVHLSPATLS